MRTKLQANEELVLEVKQHWIVLIKPLLIVLLVFFIYPELTKIKFLDLNNIPEPIKLAVHGAALGYFLFKVYDRKVNIWAVTNVRLIDEWGVITHRAKESPLEKINNVDISQTIIGRLFNYGSVAIQTAATSGETWIRYVAKPLILQETIMRMVQRGEREVEQAPRYRTQEQANLNIIKCPHCGCLIPENALNVLRVPVQAAEKKEPYIIPPSPEKARIEPTGSDEPREAFPPDPPLSVEPEPLTAPSSPAVCQPKRELSGHNQEGPNDWKRR